MVPKSLEIIEEGQELITVNRRVGLSLIHITIQILSYFC